MPSLYSPTVIGWNHPIYFDVITYLNGYDHGEPACAQPWVRFLSWEEKNKNGKQSSWVQVTLTWCTIKCDSHYASSINTHLSRPVSLWNRLSNLRILLAVILKQDKLLYVMLTLWINLYKVPLASFPILFGGPQKMITGLLSARCRNSLGLRTTLNTLECATTLRVVWFPTSVSYPNVGASFIRITHSVRSISSPAPLPSTWLELVTSAQLWQWRVIFWREKATRNVLSECINAITTTDSVVEMKSISIMYGKLF